MYIQTHIDIFTFIHKLIQTHITAETQTQTETQTNTHNLTHKQIDTETQPDTHIERSSKLQPNKPTHTNTNKPTFIQTIIHSHNNLIHRFKLKEKIYMYKHNNNKEHSYIYYCL